MPIVTKNHLFHAKIPVKIILPPPSLPTLRKREKSWDLGKNLDILEEELRKNPGFSLARLSSQVCPFFKFTFLQISKSFQWSRKLIYWHLLIRIKISRKSQSLLKQLHVTAKLVLSRECRSRKNWRKSFGKIVRNTASVLNIEWSLEGQVNTYKILFSPCSFWITKGVAEIDFLLKITSKPVQLVRRKFGFYIGSPEDFQSN